MIAIKNSVLHKELLDLYQEFPFHKHPLWQMILEHRLTKDQIILAERQHYLRTQYGQGLRKDALRQSSEYSEELFNVLVKTYIEECTDRDGTPTHLELVERLAFQSPEVKDNVLKEGLHPTPGNSAAMSLYTTIASHGPGCHILGAGYVEYYYSQLCEKIFKEYTQFYNFSPFEAETYYIHGPMDQVHASRAFEALPLCESVYGPNLIKQCVRNAFTATSLHYDGMLQAALDENNYWNGK